MSSATTYTDLRKLSDEQLVQQYDAVAQHTQIGLSFLREEIARREADRLQQQMLNMTKQMRNMTLWITVLTVVNTVAVVVTLFR